MHAHRARTLVSIFVSGVLLLLGSLVATAAVAQDKYPSRPIDFTVPWGPGGGADLLARTAGKLMEPMLGVSLPVVNVPGATGQVGLGKMINGPADGYTMEVMTGDTYSLFGAPNPRFKLSQITPLAIMIQQPSGFFVKEDAPWKNWDELLAAAKTKTLRVATTGFGSPDDITINYFRSKGYHFENIPYAKPGERYTSILGDHADVLYEQTGDVRSYVDAKQMRPLILFYPKPLNVGPFKGVPVTGQYGIHISLPQLRVVIVKAGTSPAIVAKLSEALQKVSKTPEFKKYLADQYADPNSYLPAKEARDYMANWLDKSHKIAAESAHKGLNK
ncbi:tripartite tricarboxylate transporter family receptor [mine drainage metagenome]|uniref:Tripartite tricarboxylate transporter family receptor n=1 Tax=mine drainage metagenome TaxID=410659 RepID=A0A1J5R6U3_9ZZZZ